MGEKKKIEEVLSVLKELGENENVEMEFTDNLEKNYFAEIGYFVKEGRGSYAIRMRYGRTTILKIRNMEEFEQIKALINYLDKNRHYVEAVEQLNGNRTTKRSSSKRRI